MQCDVKIQTSDDEWLYCGGILAYVLGGDSVFLSLFLFQLYFLRYKIMMTRDSRVLYRRSGSWGVFFWKVGWKVLYIIFISLYYHLDLNILLFVGQFWEFGNRKKWSLTGNLFTSIEDRISVQIYSIKNVLLTIGDAKGNDSM